MAANEHKELDKDELGNPSDQNMHKPFGYQSANDGEMFSKVIGDDLQYFPGLLPPAIEVNIDGESAPPTEVDGDIYVITSTLINLDVNTIAWISGTTVQYTFNGTPNLSGVAANDYYIASGNGKVSNDGTFRITAVNDGNDWIQVTNDLRTDATDDEAADAPGTGNITFNDWDGADHNDYVKYNLVADVWRSLSPVAGHNVFDKTNVQHKYFTGTIWDDLPTTIADATETSKGKIEIADQLEVDAGVDDLRALTSKKLKNKRGIEGFFLDARGSFGTGGGWADSSFIDNLPVLLFAQSITERAIYMFYGIARALFDTIDPSVSFIVYSTSAPSGGAEDVRWQLEARYIAENEAPGKVADETLLATQSLSNFVANERQSILTFTLNRALITDQDVLMFTIERLGGDVLDNYGADAGVGQAGILLQTTSYNP